MPSVVVVNAAETRAALAELSGTRFVARLRSSASQAVWNGLLAHFRARQAEGNKKGWRSKGFWDGTRADAVTKNMRRPAVEGDAAVIAIDSPALAHKIEGGTVKPTGGRRYLAIPATEEAYLADSVRSHLGGRLAFVYGLHEDGSWRPALAAADNYLRRIARGKNAGRVALAKGKQRATAGIGDVQFWLVRSATHPKDPRALPPVEDLAALADAAVKAELSQIMAERASDNRPQE